MEADALSTGRVVRKVEGGSRVGIGNASSIGGAARLPEQTAMPMRILWGHRLRKLVAFSSRRLEAFRAGDAPEIIATRLGTGASRRHSTADQAEFEKLFARYQQPLLDYLYGMTRDREIAEDLVQETFLRAYAAEKTRLANVTHPQAWLYRIATNVALDAGRRQRRFIWLPLGRVEPEVGPATGSEFKPPISSSLLQDDFAVSIAERDAVWRVLAELPPRWRAVLLLQTTAGFGVRDICTMLHLEESNVRKILFRAKERFRALYTMQSTGEAEGGERL
jgi:RNA polymerase sigma-70 factor, ECF subfamily